MQPSLVFVCLFVLIESFGLLLLRIYAVLFSLTALYLEYFTTPYFIFVRDTLSYLTLLGLHFLICLKPSSIPFTALEWVIFAFFLGRILIELKQCFGKTDSREAKTRAKRRKNRESKEKRPLISVRTVQYFRSVLFCAAVVFVDQAEVLIYLNYKTSADH